jgi:hypothetical protein
MAQPEKLNAGDDYESKVSGSIQTETTQRLSRASGMVRPILVDYSVDSVSYVSAVYVRMAPVSSARFWGADRQGSFNQTVSQRDLSVEASHRRLVLGW